MRVDADDYARPCTESEQENTRIEEICTQEGAAERLEEQMSDGFLKDYISPMLICDTETAEAVQEILEDVFDRCQVLTLDSKGLAADNRTIRIVENYMEEDIDLILAVGSDTIHNISRYVAKELRIPYVSVPTEDRLEDFSSGEAEMTWDGLKQRIDAQAPLAVYADPAVIEAAEERSAELRNGRVTE